MVAKGQKAIIPGKEMSKVKKKVPEIDYRKVNKCCTAKLSPNFSSSWVSIATVTYSITGRIKKIVFQCFGAKNVQTILIQHV